MQIGDGGAIDQGSFDTDDGTSHPLVGQATGRALNLRITMDQNSVLELNGTADIDLLLCRGGASGTFGGPSDTDIGSWRTRTGGTSGSSSNSSGGKDERLTEHREREGENMPSPHRFRQPFSYESKT